MLSIRLKFRHFCCQRLFHFLKFFRNFNAPNFELICSFRKGFKNLAFKTVSNISTFFLILWLLFLSENYCKHILMNEILVGERCFFLLLLVHSLVETAKILFSSMSEMIQ